VSLDIFYRRDDDVGAVLAPRCQSGVERWAIEAPNHCLEQNALHCYIILYVSFQYIVLLNL
jgi:hypothetical protein